MSVGKIRMLDGLVSTHCIKDATNFSERVANSAQKKFYNVDP